MAASKTFPGIIFVVLLTFLGLFCGTWIGGLLFVPPGSGLAGPAIALGYGVLGLLIALIVGVLLARKLAYEQLLRGLIAVGLLTVLALSFIFYRLATASQQPQSRQPVGIGMVKPRLAPEQPLYFYGAPDFDAMPFDKAPTDSLTFVQGDHFIDIKTAPPWFWPEVLKLDYNLLNLRAVTLSKNWIEVIVNRQSGETRWLDRHAVEYLHWPEYLLNVAAVEIIEPQANPVRIKPLDHAGALTLAPGAALRPLAVKGSWLQVRVGELVDSSSPAGWLRWRNAERLLISYAILE